MATKNVKGVKRADGDTYLYKDAEARTKIGTATLTTTAQNLSGAVNELNAGKASLENGKVPVSQLPSYVDDVLEYANKASFPVTGESGKIYVDLATNLTYRWSGSAYVEISPSLALGETSSTAYAGNKGKANADAIAVLNGTGTGSVSKAITNAINALDVSSVGGTGKYISAISETDGKISAMARGIDNIPTAGSPDPVKSGGVFNAINDSVSLKTATGNPITLTDAANANAEELSMTIEHIQDLHGYTKPWAGGGGKNLLPMTVDGIKAVNTNGTWSENNYTTSGVTFSILTDSNGNVTGIRANSTSIGFGATFILQHIKSQEFPYGGMILNGGVNTSAFIQCELSISPYSVYAKSSGNDSVIDASVSEYGERIINIFIRTSPNYSVNNVTFYPMIRNATETDNTFEPYSNICPISGLTSGEVTRTGKNLIEEKITNANINSDGAIIYNNSYDMQIAKVQKGVYYTVTSGETLVCGFFETKPTINSISYDASRLTTPSLTFTAPIDGYIAFRTPAAYTTPQLELGETASDYEAPVTPTTATITFGQTVYGGSVNFKTGEVTVTHGIVDLGTLEWYRQNTTSSNWRFYADLDLFRKVDIVELCGFVCSTYKEVTAGQTWQGKKGVSGNGLTSNSICVCDMTYTDAATFKTAMSGVQLCYELATPTTLTLTPAELELLKGNNTITANGAEISLSYYPDNAIGALAGRVDDKADEPIVYDATPGPTTDYSYRYLTGYNENAGQLEYIHNDHAYARLQLDTNNKPHIVMWKAGYDSVNLTNTEALFKSYIHQLEYGINGIVGSGNSATYTVNLSQEKLSYLNNITSDVQTQITGLDTRVTALEEAGGGASDFVQIGETASGVVSTGTLNAMMHKSNIANYSEFMMVAYCDDGSAAVPAPIMLNKKLVQRVIDNGNSFSVTNGTITFTIKPQASFPVNHVVAGLTGITTTDKRYYIEFYGRAIQ